MQCIITTHQLNCVGDQRFSQQSRERKSGINRYNRYTALKGIRYQGCKTPTTGWQDNCSRVQDLTNQSVYCLDWLQEAPDSMPHYSMWLQLYGIIEYSESLHTKLHGAMGDQPTSSILQKSLSNSQSMTQGDPSPPRSLAGSTQSIHSISHHNFDTPGSLSDNFVQKETYWMKDVQIPGNRILFLRR